MNIKPLFPPNVAVVVGLFKAIGTEFSTEKNFSLKT